MTTWCMTRMSILTSMAARIYGRRTSGQCHLAALGVKLKELKLFEPIEQRVQIAQKTIKDRPSDKLYDAFISLLAGAYGLVEINTRLRADAALQRAFGRNRCAEQVEQMEHSLDTSYRQHSQGYQHDYQADFQILDVDMSGLLCGPKAAFATKGYFAKHRNRRGRQLGRVLASRYREVVVDRLFDGKTQLTRALQPLLLAAERTLQLDEDKRHHTIVRVDAGGGSLDSVNWLLARGYQGTRQRLLGPTSQTPGQHVLGLTGQPLSSRDDTAAVLLAYVTFYDQRGGGVETSFKGDKQGLGLGKRSKKRFAAKPMVMRLRSLAHNVIVWARHWLASPTLQHYGTLRMVRDVFHSSGFLLTDAYGQVAQIVLNPTAPLASTLVHPLLKLLVCVHVAVNLGQT
jgi:hypothetical protein